VVKRGVVQSSQVRPPTVRVGVVPEVADRWTEGGRGLTGVDGQTQSRPSGRTEPSRAGPGREAGAGDRLGGAVGQEAACTSPSLDQAWSTLGKGGGNACGWRTGSGKHSVRASWPRRPLPQSLTGPDIDRHRTPTPTTSGRRDPPGCPCRGRSPSPSPMRHQKQNKNHST
jgi:hypothetical protein